LIHFLLFVNIKDLWFRFYRKVNR